MAMWPWLIMADQLHIYMVAHCYQECSRTSQGSLLQPHRDPCSILRGIPAPTSQGSLLQPQTDPCSNLTGIPAPTSQGSLILFDDICDPTNCSAADPIVAGPTLALCDLQQSEVMCMCMCMCLCMCMCMCVCMCMCMCMCMYMHML